MAPTACLREVAGAGGQKCTDARNVSNLGFALPTLKA